VPINQGGRSHVTTSANSLRLIQFSNCSYFPCLKAGCHATCFILSNYFFVTNTNKPHNYIRNTTDLFYIKLQYKACYYWVKQRNKQIGKKFKGKERDKTKKKLWRNKEATVELYHLIVTELRPFRAASWILLQQLSTKHEPLLDDSLTCCATVECPSTCTTAGKCLALTVLVSLVLGLRRPWSVTRQAWTSSTAQNHRKPASDTGNEKPQQYDKHC
jgi:hypothetical protein